ncbi:nucleotide exchange factor GrpE [Dactylosporangium sp. NPDC051484]|uniref:nucleotide exchange factor GrpE n=1 Tax=Dactylosporangium sp. NPDC051484 TaxID=3154942 RepID=UPI00344B038F
MSSNSLRLVAVAVALIIAVITGAATGLIGGDPDCPGATVTAPPATNAATGPAKSGGTPDQPDNPNTQAQTVETQPCLARESFGIKPALVGFVGTLLAGAALLLLLLLASRGSGAATAPVSAPPGRGGQADADRRALVQASIYVRDRVTSKALGDRLGAALQEAGVTILEPTGVRFDPAHHEAGGTTPTNDPSLSGQISGVEVPGYVDRDGRVLRAPIVTVFQAARNAGGATGAHPIVHTTQQPRREQPR